MRRDLTGDTVGDLSLQRLSRRVTSVYAAKDAVRSTWDVWSHTMHHAAGMSRALRSGKLSPETLVEIADFAVWLLTFAERLQGDSGVRKTTIESDQETLIRIEEDCESALWDRYPAMCPVCYWRRTRHGSRRPNSGAISSSCDCELLDIEPDSGKERGKRSALLRRYSRRSRKTRPESIDAWQSLFGTIYRAHVKQRRPLDVVALLLEKTGKVADALIRTYTYSPRAFRSGALLERKILLSDQLADLFCLLFLVVESLNVHAALPLVRRPSPALRLSTIIWARYGNERKGSFICPHCGGAECTCKVIVIPYDKTKEELLGLTSRA